MICESVTDINIMQAGRQDGNKTIGTTNTIVTWFFPVYYKTVLDIIEYC